jgi:hypothetical protein
LLAIDGQVWHASSSRAGSSPPAALVKAAARGMPFGARCPAEAATIAPMTARAVTWASLGRRARLWRLVHASWSVAQLAGLAYIWVCALTGRRSRRLWGSIAFLVAEGVALLAGRGNCPMGRLQADWGDPVPFFELVLPPRAAKAAVPLLAVVSIAGIAAVVLRPPGLVATSRTPAPRDGRGGMRSRTA